MDRVLDIETAILRFMEDRRICPMEELFRGLPDFTMNQKFLAVDRLSREGKVSLRYQNRAEYIIMHPRLAHALSHAFTIAETEGWSR